MSDWEQCDDGNTKDGDGCSKTCQKEVQGVDCAAIKAKDKAAKDGVYTIDPDGPGGHAPIDVFCDMTTDGGGWTLLYSNKFNTGNTLGAATSFLDTGTTKDVEYNTKTPTNSSARRTVSLDQVMLKHAVKGGALTRSVYDYSAKGLLKIPAGTKLPYNKALSTGALPATSCTLMSTYHPGFAYFKKDTGFGSFHRRFVFSHYDTNYYNQTGLFCWSGPHCGGKYGYTLFGDCNGSVAGTASAEVYVRRGVCGNGKLEGKEQCDDGNSKDGDGCSSTCAFEEPCRQMKLTSPKASVSIGSKGLGQGSSDWTQEFWIKTHKEFTGSAIFTMNENYSDQAFRNSYYKETGKVSCYTYAPNVNIYSQPVDDGQWHHVACVVKNGIFRVFTDGVPGESTQAKTSLKAKSNLAIGVPNGYKSKPAAPVVLGPIRFSSSARYTGPFKPKLDWSVDGQTVAQFLTKVPFDGKTLVDEAGGENTGTSKGGVSAVQGAGCGKP